MRVESTVKNEVRKTRKSLLNATAQTAEWYGASASGAVDFGLIPSRVKVMTLKMVFTASLLDAQH